MKVYRCDLTLHDYLFFATTERGKVAETGPFVHNYALTYALGWATTPWRHESQKPQYREELGRVKRRYITPARLIRGSYVVQQYNTLSESYSPERQQSMGYPNWGFIKCFRPGALFRGYVLSAEDIVFPRYLRLGKFMAKTALHVTPARQLEWRDQPATMEKTSSHLQPLLTWNDLPGDARPVAFDIIVNALPGHLIDHPVFQGVAGPYMLARFEDEQDGTLLPLRMGYYGVNRCESW